MSDDVITKVNLTIKGNAGQKEIEKAVVEEVKKDDKKEGEQKKKEEEQKKKKVERELSLKKLKVMELHHILKMKVMQNMNRTSLVSTSVVFFIILNKSNVDSKV